MQKYGLDKKHFRNKPAPSTRITIKRHTGPAAEAKQLDH
jgi:hypothetical protein